MKKLTALFLGTVFILSYMGCSLGQEANGKTGQEEVQENREPAGWADAREPDDDGTQAGTAEEAYAGTGSGIETSASDRDIYTDGSLDEYEISRYPKAVPVVYMAQEVSAQSMLNLYKSLGSRVTGQNTAIKISCAGSDGSGYLEPELVKDLVQYVDGTIVNCGVVSGSLGAGILDRFAEIAQTDRLDEAGTVAIPVRNGVHLSENIVGAGFLNYDGFLILTHFTENEMAGFAGAIHNISLGMSSGEGREHILDAADGQKGGNQDIFLEAMAEAGLSVSDALRGNILYMNVMNAESIGYARNGTDSGEDIHDIGIFASDDPVALDQACVDYVYMAREGEEFVRQIEALDAEHLLEYGEEIGLGDCAYTVVTIDD